jgi:hypothetical protein
MDLKTRIFELLADGKTAEEAVGIAGEEAHTVIDQELSTLLMAIDIVRKSMPERRKTKKASSRKKKEVIEIVEEAAPQEEMELKLDTEAKPISIHPPQKKKVLDWVASSVKKEA